MTAVSRLCNSSRDAIDLRANSGKSDRARLDFSLDVAFDAIYSALGIQPRFDLAVALGVDLHGDRRVITDRTSAPLDGCYAIGDIVTGLNQLGVAMRQGEVAAVDIHNCIRAREGRCLA